MTARQYAQFLEQARQRIEQDGPGEFAAGAVSLLSEIKDRSIEDGINEDSIPGKKASYSTRKMNTQKFKGKERNAAGRKYISDNPLGTWGAFREAQGLKSENVNLSYKNELWASMGVEELRKAGSKIYAIITSGRADQFDKLSEMVTLYGVFWDPTPDEYEKAMMDVATRLLKLAFKS